MKLAFAYMITYMIIRKGARLFLGHPLRQLKK